MLFVEPHEYWTFASPVKLYEYLGYQKPIISSKGTLAGSFIKNNNIGWVIPYDTNILINLLTNIINDPSQLDSIHENLKKLAPNHSWQSRAKQVCKDLTQ
ncbi:glycosyltransferase [Providencia vermicola]